MTEFMTGFVMGCACVMGLGVLALVVLLSTDKRHSGR